MGYLKKEGGFGKPWGETGQGVHFFNAEGVFLGNTGNNTFTTPSGAAYFRMNYAYQTNVDLADPSAKCMLVLGDTLPAEYVGFGSYTTASALDRLAQYSPPV